jgi:peptidoglycan/LPS O-acetylase OafA/YrhL
MAGHGASMSRVFELDGLRAIAILLVLGCHYPGFANRAHGLPRCGWIGVDIFFVLSGYLITTILLGLRGKSSPYKTFYSRRFVRILPPYLATTAVLLVAAVYQHWHVWRFLGSQLFFLQAYMPEARAFLLSLVHHPKGYLMQAPSLLSHAHMLPPAQGGLQMHLAEAPPTYWSLSIEEYFYLLWAPIVLRCSLRSITVIAGFVCLVEMLLRWVNGTMLAYFYLFCRFDALLYGAFLALLFDYWRRNGRPGWSAKLLGGIGVAGCAGIAAILFAVRPVLGRELRVSPLFLVLGLPLFSIVVAALIGLLLIHASDRWWLARLLRTRPLRFIGTISYTMYLVEILGGVVAVQILTALRWHGSALWVAFAATGFTILIAYASWHWLEKPLLRWKDRRFPNSPHPPEPALN